MVTFDLSLWNYLMSASGMVKCVMLVLLIASLFSWTLIFHEGLHLRRARKLLSQFEEKFWSKELSQLYLDLGEEAIIQKGPALLFFVGFREFSRLHKQVGNIPSIIMEGVQRSMCIVYSEQRQRLEKHIDFLATLGSTSPYIGLFGTVWGIMTSFHTLSVTQSPGATLAMVAPGISEALVATAMGLFVAIPAVIFYNRYSQQVHYLLGRYHRFQEEFLAILYRKIHGNMTHHA